jgi:hypothetical protein
MNPFDRSVYFSISMICPPCRTGRGTPIQAVLRPFNRQYGAGGLALNPDEHTRRTLFKQAVETS